MTIYQMEQFIVIARLQNLAQASQELCISEPALSRMIKSMEKELGSELFDRVGRNIILNNYGNKLLDYINKILTQYESMKEYFSHLTDEMINEIITMNIYGLDLHKLADITVGFTKLYPNIVLNAFPCSAEKSLLHLINGESDLIFTDGVFLDQYAEQIEKSGISSTFIIENRSYFIVPFDSKYASRSSVTLQEIQDEAFLGWNKTDSSEWPMEHFKYMREKENINLKNVMVYYSGDIFDRIAPNTKYYAFTDALNVCFYPNLKKMKKLIPIESKYAVSQIYLCWRKSNKYAELLARYVEREFYTFIKSMNILSKN